MGKWVEAWKTALRESRNDRVVLESPRSAADQRSEGLARALGTNGVIRKGNASWDGRVLRVSCGQIMPAGRTARRHEKNFWVAVEIPARSIVSVRSFGPKLRVVTADGREYRFLAPAVMADAIMAGIA